MIPYLFARTLFPIYLIGLAMMWVSIVSDLIFQRKQRKAKEFLIRAFVSFVWPLALVNRNGRSIFLSSFRKIFN